MKRIGGRIYLHTSNIQSLDKIYHFDIEKARHIVEVCLQDRTKWNCIRIKPNEQVAFQYSPDFNSADEPEVTITMAVDLIGKIVIRTHNNTIWHHKWMWVDSTYKGFDYEASKARSALWKPHVNKSELTKIGNKVYWESIKKRWEQCK
jgi:hypothetical protein